MRRFDLEIQDIEVIWIQLKICNNKVLFGTFYLPPHSSIEVWEKSLEFYRKCSAKLVGSVINCSKLYNVQIRFILELTHSWLSLQSPVAIT
jgi:hypothetical protein